MTLDPTRLVEAALFSAGKPLAVDDIVQSTHLKPEEVAAALKRLRDQYAGDHTALEVVRSGTKWAMAVKTQFGESTKMLAAPEIPRRVLRTLALIAFHQPIKQADLKDMVGSVVYDHVGELHDRGMVTARQDGITKILATTDRFLEYFGIDGANRDEIRTFLAKRVGIDPAKLQKPAAASGGQATLPTEASPPEGADAATTPDVVVAG